MHKINNLIIHTLILIQRRGLIILFLPLFTTFLFISCSTVRTMEREQYIMGTRATVIIPGGDYTTAGFAFREMNRLDSLLSTYKENSEISIVNRNAGIKPVKVSPRVIDILERSVEIASETGGSFDPTIGALTIDVYGFGRNGGGIPDPERIEKAKKLVNYRKLRIMGNRVFLEQKGMKIDLGGIGKGFAVDQAIGILKQKGVEKAFVSLSGDMRSYGYDHVIGIQDPENEGVIASFRTGEGDLAVSTSGDYRRYIEEKGRKVNHLIIPSSGTSGKEFSSITVVTPGDSTRADAYATALFVMDEKRALQFAQSAGGIGVLFIFSDGSIFINRDFKKFVRDLKFYN